MRREDEARGVGRRRKEVKAAFNVKRGGAGGGMDVDNDFFFFKSALFRLDIKDDVIPHHIQVTCLQRRGWSCEWVDHP